MAGGGNFIHRVISYVANELIVNGLANSPRFQRFAVRTSKKMEELSDIAAQKKKELAEQIKDASKNFEGFRKSKRRSRNRTLRIPRTLPMASALSRNVRLRLIYGSFDSHLRSLKNPIHSLPEMPIQNSYRSSLSPEFLVGRYKLLSDFTLNHRFWCTTATNSAVNQSSSSTAASTPSSGLAEGNSESGNSGGQGSAGSQDSSQKGKPVRGGPVSWMSFFLLLCTGVGLIFYYDREKRRHIEGITSASNEVRQGPSVGNPAIGGPFNLVDHNGTSVSENNFIGKWNLIYFGFTRCPDICPDELQKLASAIDKIKEKSGIEVVPIFISVDPERDTIEQVREYVKEFHPNLIGLTGTPDEIRKTARAYRVYYMKTEDEGSDYLVDHSIVIYLMDPSMQFVKFFGKNEDVTSLADGVILEISNAKQKAKA